MLSKFVGTYFISLFIEERNLYLKFYYSFPYCIFSKINQGKEYVVFQSERAGEGERN